MLYTIVLAVLKLVVALAFTYLLVLAIFHVLAIRKLSFYERQGVVVFPGARRFFFGNSHSLIDYVKMRAEGVTFRGPQGWMAFELFPRKMGHDDSYQSELHQCNNYPIVIVNFQSEPVLWVSDPEIVQDIFVHKHAHIDKAPESYLMFKCVIGESILFSPGDESYRIKRKALAHAFYKDRL